MYSDPVRQEVFDQLRDRDCSVFAKYLTWGVFVEAARRAGLRLWSCPLNLANLAWLGISAAWRKGDSFVTILTVTLKLLQDQEHFGQSAFGQDLAKKQRSAAKSKKRKKKISKSAAKKPKQKKGKGKPTAESPKQKEGKGKPTAKSPKQKKGKPAAENPKQKKGKGKPTAESPKQEKDNSKHRPHGKDPAQVTEEAFAKARQRMPIAFWFALLTVLVERFEAEHAERLRFRGFRLLAMDGTRLTLPDEEALRTFYGTASNGHGQHNAQARMVLLQSPLTRLPLAYQLQPVKIGEVTMARQLASGLRPDDLLLLDSGYVSYGLLWDIQRRNAFFCIRLQRAMNLCTLRTDRQTGDRWVRWTPKDSRGQWRREGLPRSLELRLVEYQVPGYRRIVLATNVLATERLSHDDFCRLTTSGTNLLPGLYHMRWEVETSFAEMKIKQQMEGGFRSRKPAGIAYEVAGHVVLYLLVRWLIVEAAVKHGEDPLRISFIDALRELQQLWSTIAVSSPEWVAETLMPRLLQRIASHLVPYRPGRSYPRKKKKKQAKAKTTKSKGKKQAKAKTTKSKQTKS